MIVARIEFKPEFAPDFCHDKHQFVVETMFESIDALMQTIKEFEHCINDCTVVINGKVINLRSFSVADASEKTR